VGRIAVGLSEEELDASYPFAVHTRLLERGRVEALLVVYTCCCRLGELAQLGFAHTGPFVCLMHTPIGQQSELVLGPGLGLLVLVAC